MTPLERCWAAALCASGDAVANMGTDALRLANRLDNRQCFFIIIWTHFIYCLRIIKQDLCIPNKNPVSESCTPMIMRRQ